MKQTINEFDDNGRTQIGNTPTDTENPEALLEAAQEAQSAFWSALKALEDATGLEIDSTQDLNNWTVDSLLKSADGEDGDEQEIPVCEACGCTDGTCQHAS